ncbi:hypothetical protein JQ628_30370 [Bradyrhizobium lablabi]|uniref:hypothetical protein n=1 Tax=Bradyrhizobium lablabi TaxID=722472 RepID=UPI001BA66150|nr:hypothetical protein [Bradyrhizobium lablabi]MBR1125864.1 hypothetical protein [Bradyrhizobium lablabi]
MRFTVLAIAAIQLGWMQPACAQGTQASAPPIAEMLPLFAKNRCAEVRDAAEQLFCGDPDLNRAGARLGSAVDARLNRIADRRMAIEENVEWIRSRNSSCGIFVRQGVAVAPENFSRVKACLLKVTADRIAILEDANFDCLATNTTAGLVICSDPALAIANREINTLFVGLIGKLREDEVKGALTEYARWTRIRDRLCGLDDKDNVPLEELESTEPCLADYMKQKSAELADAKGDPRKIFGREVLSPSPDADAVDLCVGKIHSTNTCENFLRISRVSQLDTEVSAQEAIVTAEIEMKVLAPFAVCSPIASNCTGTCWDPQTGQPKASTTVRQNFPEPSLIVRQNLAVAYRVRIEKSFAFRKSKSGDWQCHTQALRPVEFGRALERP